MKYCTKCTMPDTRPGIVFDENGVCSACNITKTAKMLIGTPVGKSLKNFATNTEVATARDNTIAPLPFPAVRTVTSRYI